MFHRFCVVFRGSSWGSHDGVGSIVWDWKFSRMFCVCDRNVCLFVSNIWSRMSRSWLVGRCIGRCCKLAFGKQQRWWLAATKPLVRLFHSWIEGSRMSHQHRMIGQHHMWSQMSMSVGHGTTRWSPLLALAALPVRPFGKAR